MKRTLRNGLNGLFGLFITFLLIKAAAGPEQKEKHTIELQCPPAVEAHIGETVTLPCSTKYQIDVCKDLTVEWLYWDKDSKTDVEVLLVHRGKENLQHQDERFKGKTVLLLTELCSGNFSLQITVNTSHSGTYTCTFNTGVEKNSCSTTLTVRAALKHFTTTPPKQTGGVGNADANKQDPGAIIRGPIAAITVIATISGIIIGAIIAAFKKKRNENAEENQGTGEEMTGLRVDGDPNTPEAGASSVAESSV